VPPDEVLRALRVFANQAAGALHSAAQMDELRHLAAHDPLTGLRNRRDLSARIDAAIAAGVGPVSVLLLDLDHFKQVNDRYGHEAGDRALALFADLLRASTRPGDTAARIGGEEFALVLPDTILADAFAVAERIRRRMPAFFAEEVPWLRVSVGVAASGRDGDDAESLLQAGDRALYTAKRLGRDRSVAHDPDLVRRSTELGAGENRLQYAAARALVEALKLQGPGAAPHARAVGARAQSIAERLGWGPERVERVRIAGLLHDLGTLALPDGLLTKSGPLAPAEREEIRRHPELGAQILDGAGLSDIAGWVRAHHERTDGRGYPRGLAGAAIPPEARVLAVAEAYEEMIAARPHPAVSPAEARSELRLGVTRGRFDSAVVDALLAGLDAPSAALVVTPSA
jgi:diguanylate cyclase (GGDEF)-like protein